MASPGISPTGGWIGTTSFLLLFAATLAIFSARVSRLIILLAKGRQEQRVDHLWDRIGEILLVVLGQKSVLRDPLPGIAHFLTFWGFIVTGLGGLDLALAAFRVSLPLIGGNRVFAVLQDALIVLVVLALLLFAVRRVVMRTGQLSRVLHGPRDGFIILGLILMTVVTLVPVEDFLYALSQGTAWKPLGHGPGGGLLTWATTRFFSGTACAGGCTTFLSSASSYTYRAPSTCTCSRHRSISSFVTTGQRARCR